MSHTDQGDPPQGAVGLPVAAAVQPVPVSAPGRNRHRAPPQNRANDASERGCHLPTKDYVARRTGEGKTKTEIMRCLKRYIAHEVFPHLLMAAPCTVSQQGRKGA